MIKRKLFISTVSFFCIHVCIYAQIDRHRIVSRHNVVISEIDSMGSLSVGNGNFAFTIDPTGLQSFPEFYKNGVPLGTQSDWGWHRFPNDSLFTFEETYKSYLLNGRNVSYSVQGHESDRKNRATDYFRSNPHRLQLANIGFEMIKTDGKIARIDDLKKIHQILNLWNGEIKSAFEIEGNKTQVITLADPHRDAISFRVKSDLIKKNLFSIKIRIPVPTGAWKDVGLNWENYQGLSTNLISNKHAAQIEVKIDESIYYIRIHWQGKASILAEGNNTFSITPGSSNDFECTIEFQKFIGKKSNPGFKKTSIANRIAWNNFWKSGAFVDFSNCTDVRAFELERRMVLSLYLTRIQTASDNPAQETGLTYNSWYGRPHMEMHWWHAVHFAWWNRTALMEKSMQWYFKSFHNARVLASRQGYKGVRWQKMTDGEGNESPSSVGSFLIWQQPHIIFMCELLYGQNPSLNVLNKYKELVFETAAFMSDFLVGDSLHHYRLGPGIIPAQESHDALSTINPTFELAYWKYGLEVANHWRERLKLPLHSEWKNKVDRLSPLPTKDGLYLAALSAPDSYSNEKYLRDHPSVLAAIACLPESCYLDPIIMKHTLDTIMKKWNWASTWGWDFPMTAMAATKLNEPQIAVDALMMNAQKNTYLLNGHNYQDGRLTIYLPGNGALLAAIATMCKESNGISNPGFPKGGKWNVISEGF
ncbi:MAG: hypothetical protein ABI844_03945 [Saprospiraceae bacterium]